MKICPICDKKIDGNWCGSCFKLVTPIHINNGIYINERHPAQTNTNCDYHNPKIKYDKQEYMQPGYENKIYGNTGNAGKNEKSQQPAKSRHSVKVQQPVARKTNTSVRQNQKKKVSVGAVIAIVYVVFILIGVVFALIGNIAENGGLDNIFVVEKETENRYNVSGSHGASLYDDYDYEYDYDYDVEEEYTFDYDDSESDYEDYDYSFLDAIEPIGQEVDEFGYTNYYYDAKDIKELGYVCDYVHMDITVDDLRDIVLPAVCPGAVFEEKAVEVENANIYVETDSGYGYTQFEQEYQFWIDGIVVYASADTASDELHYYFFATDSISEEFCEIVYNWCDLFAQGNFDSVEEVKEYYDTTVNESGYEYIDTDEYSISFMGNDGLAYFYVEPAYY